MEVYAILFFEASADTIIRKSNDSKLIPAGQTEQVTNEKWADNVEDAKAEALAELPELLCEGAGNWYVGVFSADPEGNDDELLWESIPGDAAKGANTMNAIIITHTHTCLPFAELDEKTKGKVLEKYRDFNVDGFDWWQWAYDDFAEQCLKKGIEVDLKHTYFSLGYSQSDYVAITAQVVDIDKFLAELGGFDKKATRLIKYAMNNGYLPGVGCSAGRSSTRACIDWDNPHEYNQGDNSAAYAYAEKVLTDLSESAESYFKDLSREIYQTLRDEYENLTSEDCLADSFDANDCVFEIGTGKMYHKD